MRCCYCARAGGIWVGFEGGSGTGGDEDDALAGAEGVVEGFGEVIERVFGGDVAQGGAGLDEAAEVVGVEVLVVMGVFVKDEQSFLGVLHRGFPEEEDVGVVGGEDAGGAFLAEDGVLEFEVVDAGDEVGEVHVDGFPVGGLGVDDVEGFAEAEFEADGHHDAGGEEGGEEVALFEGVGVAVEFGGEAGGVVAFGEADGAGDFADEVVLFEKPAAVEVPPFGAVEDVVEAGAGGFEGLGGGAAEGFGGEAGVGVALPGVVDEALPEGAGDLVGGVAAEAVEAEGEQGVHDAAAVAVEALGVARVLVVELGQVGPDDSLVVVLTGGVGGAAVGLADEPLGVLADEGGVNGAVVDDEVNHEAQAAFAGAGGQALDLGFRGSGVGGVEEPGVEAEVVGDGVEAAGGAGELDGVEEEPVEAEGAGAVEVRLPAVEGAGQEGEEVVEDHGRGQAAERTT